MTKRITCLGMTLLVGLSISVRAQETEYVPVGENIVVHATPTADTIDGRTCVASSSNLFFVAWSTISGRVAFTRVTREGTVLDPGGISLGTGTSYPSAVWNGSQFFCTWVNNGEILGVRVNPDGTVVDATPLHLVPQADSYPRPCPIVFNGTDYLIVWRTNSQIIRAARLSLAGVLLDPDMGFSVGEGFYPRVVWSGNGYLVVWYNWGPEGRGLDIFGARVSSEGSVVAPGAFVISSRTSEEFHPQAAFDGTNYLVAWTTSPANTSDPGDLCAVRVSTSGVVLDSEPILVDGDRAIGESLVIHDGQNFLIVFQRDNGMKNFRGSDVYARRMRGDGTFLDGVPFPLCTAYWNQWNPFAGYSDGVLLCTWLDNRTGRVVSGHGLISGQIMSRVAMPEAGQSKKANERRASVQAPAAPWAAVTSPVSTDIYNIAGLNQESFYAVGYLAGEPGGYALRLQNGQWNHWTDFKRMYGLWADSPENIRTVGWCWTVAGFSGGLWDPGNCQGNGDSPDPYQIGFGIWGADINHIMTVGTEGAYQWFNGTNWIQGLSGVRSDLVDAWGTAADNIYAVGEAGTVMHYNGLSWSKVTAIPTRQSLAAIWGSGPNDIFIVGDYGTILHYDGLTWGKLESGTTRQLRDVSGFNGSDVYAIGINGTILHYDGVAWQAETSGILADLFGVAAAGHTVWAVGANGVILKKEFESTTPEIQLDKTHLYFGAAFNSTGTGSQAVSISNAGGGTLNWSASKSAGWITVSSLSGTGNAVLRIGADPAGLAAGTYQGTVSISDSGAANSPQTIAVTLNVLGTGLSAPPFGDYSTPLNGTTGITGAIPVTGWALDDIETVKVEIKRDSVGTDPAGAIGPDGLVYLGDAIFVEGARPDVEIAYPGYPLNSRAGWGYMLLTNFLPNQGNGTFNIHAFAYDPESHKALLGTKTITCSNAAAVKPFGTIDTPAQGGDVSGSAYLNFGWILTPQPSEMPKDGSTISAWVDGIEVGVLKNAPNAYNQYRADIAGLFPGLKNSAGPVGFLYLDTTEYENGVHTIYWIAADDSGHADGIGSRYFNIRNTGSPSLKSGPTGQSLGLTNPGSFTTAMNLPVSFDPLGVKRGFHLADEPEAIKPDEHGVVHFDLREVERVELDLKPFLKEGRGSAGALAYSGFLAVNDRLRPLPIGSTLDRKKGTFSWLPGPGFLGPYQFVFMRKNRAGGLTKIQVNVRIIPKWDLPENAGLRPQKK